MKLKLEVTRINNDVIATSGMCEYINPSYAHWRFYDVYFNNDFGEKMGSIDVWRYSQEDGWTYSHDDLGHQTSVSTYESLYDITINDGDIYRVGTDSFVKCEGDHSYLFGLEEN